MREAGHNHSPLVLKVAPEHALGKLKRERVSLDSRGGALVHGSGLSHTMVVIGPRSGVTTHEIPEAERVQGPLPYQLGLALPIR